MTVLGLGVAGLAHYKKTLFWVHDASHGNNYITFSFCASLLVRLHGLCFCAMALTCALTPPQKCSVWTLQV